MTGQRLPAAVHKDLCECPYRQVRLRFRAACPAADRVFVRRLWGVGEPTLTADGAWLYFVAVFKIKGGEFDADVARVWRT